MKVIAFKLIVFARFKFHADFVCFAGAPFYKCSILIFGSPIKPNFQLGSLIFPRLSSNFQLKIASK